MLLVSSGRRERHRDRGWCQPAAKQHGPAGSSTSPDAVKGHGVPAGDRPPDILAGAAHGSEEPRLVAVGGRLAWVCGLLTLSKKMCVENIFKLMGINPTLLPSSQADSSSSACSSHSTCALLPQCELREVDKSMIFQVRIARPPPSTIRLSRLRPAAHSILVFYKPDIL